LFITGFCAQKCFYCPISEQKYGHDVVFANETPIKNPEKPTELFEEVRLTKATGAGITGGDPLVKVDRCATYIRLLKKKYGKSFHIHLYTPLKLVTKERLEKLATAGLDEIRFHPDLDDEKLWSRLDLAKRHTWDIGIEIPALPGYQKKIERLLQFARGKISFINFNELELSDTTASHYQLHNRRYQPKDSISYGVKGSAAVGIAMVKKAAALGIPAHFCTAKLKDGVQVKQRLKARAKTISTDLDQVTSEGTLLRGAVYLSDLVPGMGYREMLKKVPQKKTIERLRDAKFQLILHGWMGSEVVIDPKKYRLLSSVNLVRARAAALKKLCFVPAVVEEYPTADAFEVEIEFV